MVREKLGWIVIGAVLLFMAAGVANAGPIAPISAIGTGGFNNSTGLLINGEVPAEVTGWTASTNVWWYGLSPTFTIDLGTMHMVEDVLVSVDNNDSYSVDYSVNNSDWFGLFSIAVSHGEVGWGMDTMSTLAGHLEYIAAIDFATVQARYLRIYATGGDNRYSVGEIMPFGNPVGTPLPEPSTVLLLGSGLAGLVYARRRSQNSARVS